MNNKTKVTINQPEHYELKGIRNSGTENFECTNCGKKLLILQLVTSPSIDKQKVTTKIVVKCQCGGYSMVKTIQGMFYPGAPDDHTGFDTIQSDDSPKADIVFKSWNK